MNNEPRSCRSNKRVGDRLALHHRDERAVDALADLALCARRVAVEDVVEQARARRRREVLGAEADEAARRNPILEPHAAAPVGHHRDELALALRKARHHAALVLLAEVDRELLPRLVHDAVDDALDDGRPRYRELVAFTPHVLDQHREVQLAAAGHAELVRVVGFLDAQRDVVQ